MRKTAGLAVACLLMLTACTTPSRGPGPWGNTFEDQFMGACRQTFSGPVCGCTLRNLESHYKTYAQEQAAEQAADKVGGSAPYDHYAQVCTGNSGM